jgi:hypothetical protein
MLHAPIHGAKNTMCYHRGTTTQDIPVPRSRTDILSRSVGDDRPPSWLWTAHLANASIFKSAMETAWLFPPLTLLVAMRQLVIAGVRCGSPLDRGVGNRSTWALVRD